jgi:hypothetical protein
VCGSFHLLLGSCLKKFVSTASQFGVLSLQVPNRYQIVPISRRYRRRHHGCAGKGVLLLLLLLLLGATH